MLGRNSIKWQLKHGEKKKLTTQRIRDISLFTGKKTQLYSTNLSSKAHFVPLGHVNQNSTFLPKPLEGKKHKKGAKPLSKEVNVGEKNNKILAFLLLIHNMVKTCSNP